MNRLSWYFIIGAVIICGTFGFFYLYPQANSSLKTYQETQKAKNNLTDVTKEKELLTNLSKNDQLSKLYDIASKYIPETEQSGELVIELSAMANQNKLQVEQISFESATTSAETTKQSDTTTNKTDSATTNQATEPAKSSENKELTFTLKLGGTFTDYINFLNNLSTSSRLISITSMTLTKSSDSFSAQISGKAYWKKGTNLEKNLTNIEISQATIDKFQNLKTYGSPIDLPTESGFGRPDPFAPIP